MTLGFELELPLLLVWLIFLLLVDIGIEPGTPKQPFESLWVLPKHSGYGVPSLGEQPVELRMGSPGLQGLVFLLSNFPKISEGALISGNLGQVR